MVNKKINPSQGFWLTMGPLDSSLTVGVEAQPALVLAVNDAKEILHLFHNTTCNTLSCLPAQDINKKTMKKPSTQHYTRNCHTLTLCADWRKQLQKFVLFNACSLASCMHGRLC